MATTHTHTKFGVAVGTLIAGAAAPALLFLGAGTAHALQDISEAVFAPAPAVQDISEAVVAPVPAIQDVSEAVFVPAPAVQDVSDVIDPGSKVGILDPGSRPPLIIDPGSKVGIVDPGLKVGVGGPDTGPR